MTNPFMSMWLSAFNSATGAARGHVAAELQRQHALFWREMTRQTVDFWSGAWLAGAARSADSRSNVRKTKR